MKNEDEGLKKGEMSSFLAHYTHILIILYVIIMILIRILIQKLLRNLWREKLFPHSTFSTGEKRVEIRCMKHLTTLFHIILVTFTFIDTFKQKRERRRRKESKDVSCDFVKEEHPTTRQ